MVNRIFEAQVVGAFKQGLRPELQAAVCAARPKTMAEAMAVATEIAAVKKETAEEKQVLPIKSEARKQSKDACHKCGRSGHWARDCYTRNPENRGSWRGRGGRGSRSSYGGYKQTYGNQNHQSQNHGNYNQTYRGRGQNYVNYNNKGRGRQICMIHAGPQQTYGQNFSAAGPGGYQEMGLQPQMGWQPQMGAPSCQINGMPAPQMGFQGAQQNQTLGSFSK